MLGVWPVSDGPGRCDQRRNLPEPWGQSLAHPITSAALRGKEAWGVLVGFSSRPKSPQRAVLEGLALENPDC